MSVEIPVWLIGAIPVIAMLSVYFTNLVKPYIPLTGKQVSFVISSLMAAGLYATQFMELAQLPWAADPVAATGSLIALVGLSWKSAQALYDMIQNYKAPA